MKATTQLEPLTPTERAEMERIGDQPFHQVSVDEFELYRALWARYVATGGNEE